MRGLEQELASTFVPYLHAEEYASETYQNLLVTTNCAIRVHSLSCDIRGGMIVLH